MFLIDGSAKVLVGEEEREMTLLNLLMECPEGAGVKPKGDVPMFELLAAGGIIMPPRTAMDMCRFIRRRIGETHGAESTYLRKLLTDWEKEQES